jgi:hypothetical protein
MAEFFASLHHENEVEIATGEMMTRFTEVATITYSPFVHSSSKSHQNANNWGRLHCNNGLSVKGEIKQPTR